MTLEDNYNKFFLPIPNNDPIEFSRIEVENNLRNKVGRTGIKNKSFSGNIYYINLDNKRMLMMYNTNENQNIFTTYDEVLYDKTFDPDNKLKFVKEDGSEDNLMTAYAGNGDYTDLSSAHLLIATIKMESLFLVSLNDNVDLSNPKTKIIFDKLMKNDDDLYQNGELVVKYSGTYSIHGTINVYCTKSNIVPADITISVFHNSEPFMDTTVTIRHTNMIHNIPINLSVELTAGDKVYLEADPSRTSDRLFIKKNSYWNCRLVNLTL